MITTTSRICVLMLPLCAPLLAHAQTTTLDPTWNLRLRDRFARDTRKIWVQVEWASAK